MAGRARKTEYAGPVVVSPLTKGMRDLLFIYDDENIPAVDSCGIEEFLTERQKHFGAVRDLERSK